MYVCLCVYVCVRLCHAREDAAFCQIYLYACVQIHIYTYNIHLHVRMCIHTCKHANMPARAQNTHVCVFTRRFDREAFRLWIVLEDSMLVVLNCVSQASPLAVFPLPRQIGGSAWFLQPEAGNTCTCAVSAWSVCTHKFGMCLHEYVHACVLTYIQACSCVCVCVCVCV
jgi:hypothetical protein